LSGNSGLLQRHKAAQAQRHGFAFLLRQGGMDSPSSFAKASAGQVGEAILIKSCCFDYGAIIFRDWYYMGASKQMAALFFCAGKI